MNIYRCIICGDVYITSSHPDVCPFCGAPKRFMVDGADWQDGNKNLELTDISRANLTKALDLELHATALYRCIASTTTNVEVQSMLKGFAKVEAEHATLISKALKMSPDDLAKITESCNANDQEMVQKTFSLEDNAVKEYSKSLSEATEPRVKDIFAALVVAERGHLGIVKRWIDGNKV